jgi:hypothetical protein
VTRAGSRTSSRSSADRPKLAASTPIAHAGPTHPEIPPAAAGPATAASAVPAKIRPLARVTSSPGTMPRTAVTAVT